MKEVSDRPFDWVAAMAFASGAVVLVPSLAALAVAIISVFVSVL